MLIEGAVHPSEGSWQQNAAFVLLNFIKAASARFLCFCLHFCLFLTYPDTTTFMVLDGLFILAEERLQVWMSALQLPADTERASCFQFGCRLRGSISGLIDLSCVCSCQSNSKLFLFIIKHCCSHFSNPRFEMKRREQEETAHWYLNLLTLSFWDLR